MKLLIFRLILVDVNESNEECENEEDSQDEGDEDDQGDDSNESNESDLEVQMLDKSYIKLYELNKKIYQITN